MENWGLIKYRETNLLLKEGETSSSAKEGIAKIVAHEIGHQVTLVSSRKLNFKRLSSQFPHKYTEVAKEPISWQTNPLCHWLIGCYNNVSTSFNLR